MEKKDWKDTLLMAKTDFSMKAGLVEKEPQYRQEWLDKEIYQKALKMNKENGKGSFVLHDGPPYANGNLHVGHALNKILKDIIVRHKTMEGYYSPFVPGWDTHGLPIENKMLEELKMTKDDMDQVTLRKEAAKYAKKQVANQMSQFKEMQLFTDFSKIYRTLDKEFEVGQLKLFKSMALKGLIYKGLKPIYWSPSSQSALAEAEVEYEDIRSPQVIVAMQVKEGNEKVKEGDELLIMTTTPWTIPANSGIAVGINYEYSRVKANDRFFVVASELLESISELAKWETFEVVDRVIGSEIIGVKYESPINKNLSPVVEGHHVTTDAGTGLVHMAPLFGEDDYLIGKAQDLNMIMHVDAKGMLNEAAGKYAGKFYEAANKDVGMDLDADKRLLSLKFIKHSYPHDWRTHKPVIYRGVPQWFVNIKEIKDDILNALKDVKSKPSWGVDRISKMIADRSEWTISRQRTWGVPLIVFYDKDNNPVIEEEILDHVIKLVEEHGTDIWWEKEADELLPESYKGKGFTKEMDIMDVWFDSGSSHMSVKPGGEEAPFDLYLEGSDQYRGWFNSSLINSVAYRGKSPYKHLLSHGFVLDGKQQKMSKSKGNVVDPLDIIRKNGADVLRLWAANAEYTSDVTISNDILKQVIEIYRRIRNTVRFMLGNISDYDNNKDKVELKNMHRYISEVTMNYEANIKAHYDNYSFSDVVKETNKFFIDLSGWYFDYAKDTLYCDDANHLERRSVQTNIFNILRITLRAIAPILPTTAEEAYQLIPNFETKESIYLERQSYEPETFNHNEAEVAFYNEYRASANKVLEEARKSGLIKRNNEAILTVNIPEEHRILSEVEFARALMVAKVKFGTEFKVETINNSVKCQRCWNHFDENEISEENICQRCTKVVNN